MLTRLIFILTLFGSAFLSFSIQPLLGKMMLPIVGGAPAGWIVAMAFFQLALLGGYMLSYLLTKLPPILHGLLLLGLYASGLFFMPPIITTIDLSADASFIGWDVLKILTQTIALPFVALTATTSALLRIFSNTSDPTAKDPYYLFISSNIGSLIGLFIYPIVLEPFVDLNNLSHWWYYGYGVVIAGITLCVLLALRHRVPTAIQKTIVSAPMPSVKTLASWFALAFVPCSLSMAVTTLITTDIGNLPLFWTLPLGLYLLSFILGFRQKLLVQTEDLQFYHILSAGTIFILIAKDILTSNTDLGSLLISLFILLGLFFMICWSCHQTLASERPATTHLTLYYFIIALGGAAAGVLNAFVAPIVLNDVVEFPLSLVLSLLIPAIWNRRILPPSLDRKTVLFAGITLIGAGALAICYYLKPISHDTSVTFRIAMLVFIPCALVLISKPRYLVLIGIAATFYYTQSSSIGSVIFQDRNFFGTSRVMQITDPNDNIKIRMLRHGNTIHGLATYDPQGKPTYDMGLSYYSKNGQINDIYSTFKPRNIAIFGLGTGQLACYAPNKNVTYFEIDPDMATLAENYFPYLKKCPVKNIIIGDARLTFIKEKPHAYDLLILDVFSSDGIPTHILTTDALKSYPPHLTKNGVMLFHISNRYLDLAPQIAASAEKMGLNTYRKVYHVDTKKERLALDSEWVAVPLQASGNSLLSKKEGWKKVIPAQTQAWTDQRSSMLLAVKSFKNWIGGSLAPIITFKE